MTYKFGYARVSTDTQKHDLQISALENFGVDELVIETASTRKQRPKLDDLLSKLRKGDQVVTWRLDRIGRSVSDLLNIVQTIEDKGASFVCTEQSIDTSNAGGKLIFHIFASLAEFERDLLRERTLAGLAIAKEKGHKAGPKEKLSEDQKELLHSLMSQEKRDINAICQTFGISRQSVYRIYKVIDEMKAKTSNDNDAKAQAS